MTKSKKLISMLLALVMLLTSCSVSFFAYADDVADANDLAVIAMKGMTANQVKTADTNLMNKVKAMSASDREAMNPVYYAYALYVATTQVLIDGGIATGQMAANRPKRLKSLADESAADHSTVKDAYESYIGPVPSKYLAVINDLNALNTEFQIKDDTYLTATTKQYLFTTATSLYTNLNFPTNSKASGYFSTFWEKYKDYDEAQILFADFVPANTNGVTDAFTTNIVNNAVLTNTISSDPETTLNYYFAEDSGYRISDLYFLYTVHPLNANVVKAKYTNSSGWISDTAPAEYYGELSEFYTKANTNVKAFYVNYLSEFANASENYAGLENIGDVIDVGLKLQAGESVPFSQIKSAYNKYNGLKDAAKTLIATISSKSTFALFNATIKDITTKEAILFGENDAESSIAYLSANAGTMNKAVAYQGDKIMVLIQAVIDAYNENKDLDEFEELVTNTVAKPVITADDVTAVWGKFKNNLSAEQRLTAKNSGTLWTNVTTIMTSQFVQYVNAVDMNNVTDTNRTQSTALLNAIVVETVDETNYDFKTVVTTSDDYKTVYNKYYQIQIDKFRKYVEGVDLNNVTAENRTRAKELYDELSDEYKAFAQSDNELYNKYLAILASEFKDYIESINLNEVTDAIRQQAQEKYEELSDAAKETVYNDQDLWDKYCQIQTPAVDADTHEAEKAKVADKVTQPTKEDSEAVKDIGVNKSIDNVEDFIIDDLLPLLTDQIQITDKNDAVNSALEKHYTNATVGKIYSLYANLSHNQEEIDGKKVGELVQTQLIPVDVLYGTLFEDEFSQAKAKIATAQIPTDDEGNPEELDIIIGYDYNNNPIYETANIYDGIAALEFESGDFGFEDGDKEGFTKALLAVLRPITGLCAPGSPLGIEFFNHVDKKTGKYTLGIYECALTLLESLGVTGLPTNDAFAANYQSAYMTAYNSLPGDPAQKQQLAAYMAGDALLAPIFEGVYAFIDSELKTLDDVIALIPRIGDLIRSSIPRTVYTNFKADLGMLAGLFETIEYNGTDVPIELILDPYVLPDALLYLINEKLDLGVTFKMPNWAELNKYTTFKVNPSSQQNKDYVAVRYINGKAMFSEFIYYAYDNLIADDANSAAFKEKLGGLPLVGDNITPLVDKAKEAGKMKTYGAILDYFYESEEEKNHDATADAGASIGEAIAGINEKLNFASIDCSNAVIKLSKKKFNYNGKIQKPSVKVTLNGETLTKGTAYKVTYSNSSSKKIGTYKVKVTFIGAYEGAAKTFKYTIGPKNATRLKATGKSGAIKVTWKRSASKVAKGYVIQYSTNSKFKNAKQVVVSGRSKTSKTISGLDKGKKYYVRIKAYSVKKGKKIYSAYTSKKAATVK